MITSFKLNNIRGDLYGGITSAIVALPLALAFGVASGIGPIAGLYGAIFVGFFASLFGGTPSQISGPTGPMTIVVAAVVAKYIAIDPINGPLIAFTVVIMGGIFQIAFGVMRLGAYVNYIPYPVVSGVMSGVGFILIILQLVPLLGYPPVTGGPLNTLHALPQYLQEPSWNAIALTAFTLGIVVFWPEKLNRILPAPLVALVAGTTLVSIGLFGEKLSVLGNIPQGLPWPHLPVFNSQLLVDMLKSAIVLAVLGSMDSLLTSLIADNMTRTHHNSDRELIGQGIGNIVAGLFSGLPGAGATMRTAVNIRAGGRTPLSGITHSLILLFIVLGAGNYAAQIPHAVLAGILIKVGINIIDWQYITRAHKAPKVGVFIMATVTLVTVFVDLMTAVVIGVVGACILTIKKLTEQQLQQIFAVNIPEEGAPLSKQEKTLLNEAQGKILLYHLTGPFSFGAARDIVKRLASFSNYDVLVLDLSDVLMVDTSAALAIEDIINSTLHGQKSCVLVLKTNNVKSTLERLNILDKVNKKQIFNTRAEALIVAKDIIIKN